MLSRPIRLVAVAATAFLFTCSLALAQSSCGVGKLTAQDHERVIAAIVKNVADIARRIDYRHLTPANRDIEVLKAARSAEEMPGDVKQCIDELLKRPSLAELVQSANSKWPNLREPLQSVFAEIRRASSPDAVERVLERNYGKFGKEMDTALGRAKDIFEAGKNSIYSAKTYVQTAVQFRGSVGELTAGQMATRIAVRDVEGAMFGALWGLAVGPEGAPAGAAVGAIKASGMATVQLFVDLWLGAGTQTAPG
jgi:hypothetical protein